VKGPQEPEERIHEVVTPEGVPLRFRVAPAGDRVGALLLDLLIVLAAVLALVLLVAVSAGGGDLALAVALLATFLIWTFYFPAFELAWQGQTPGKRALKIRAVDGRGGPLTAEAVMARNLTREVELFLPLLALASLKSLGLSGFGALLPLGWVVVFGFLPLFNRDRLRVGDMVAGTIVIRAPEAVLLEDLLSRAPAWQAAFTEAQLDVYGVYELQILEGVLRGAGQPGHAEAVRTVAEKIRERIGFEGRVEDDERFLRAFYAALRGKLERRLLFGRRRRSKHDRA